MIVRAAASVSMPCDRSQRRRRCTRRRRRCRGSTARTAREAHDAFDRRAEVLGPHRRAVGEPQPGAQLEGVGAPAVTRLRDARRRGRRRACCRRRPGCDGRRRGRHRRATAPASCRRRSPPDRCSCSVERRGREAQRPAAVAGARRGRRRPHRAAGDGERGRRAPERDAAAHRARARVDADHGARRRVGHPDRAESGGDRDRAAADAHRVADRVGRRVDARDRAVVAVGDPDAAVADGDRRPARCRPRSASAPRPSADRAWSRRRPPRRPPTPRRPPAAIAAGPPGTSIRWIRPPCARSSRSTCPSTAEATQTAPPATATPRGALPAGRRSTTRFVRESTWSTRPFWPSATHSEPSPKATAVGSPPTSIVVTWPRSRSTRETVPSRPLAIHTEPAPAASASGACPTAVLRDDAPAPGSITPAASSAIRVEPARAPPAATTSTAAPRRSRRRRRPRQQPGGAAARGAGSAGRRRTVELRVLAQDRVVEAAQLGTRLEPDLVEQHLPRVAGRPPAPPPAGRSDTARACAGRAAARATDARGPASSSSPSTSAWRPSASAASIAASRARSQSSSSRRISAAANGSSARSSSGGPRHSASASRECAPFSPDAQQALEAQRVDGVGIHAQLIAAPARDDLRVGAAELLAQLRDQHLHEPCGAVAGGRSPHSPSISRSADTGALACSASIASNARGFAPPNGRARPSWEASTRPRRRISMTTVGEARRAYPGRRLVTKGAA